MFTSITLYYIDRLFIILYIRIHTSHRSMLLVAKKKNLFKFLLTSAEENFWSDNISEGILSNFLNENSNALQVEVEYDATTQPPNGL